MKNSRQIQQPIIAAFYNDEKYSKALFKEFESVLRANKISIQFQVNLKKDPFNLDQELDNVRDANILALFPDGSTDTNTAYNNALAVLKSDKVKTIQKILGSNPLLQFQAITNQVKSGEKFVLATDWHFQCGKGGKGQFNDVANTIWGGDVNRLTALSYEAVQVLFPRFQVPQTKVTRDNIGRQLENMHENPIQSDVFKNKKISFNKTNGDRNEIQDRLLVTPDPDTKNDNEQFKLLEGQNQKCL